MFNVIYVSIFIDDSWKVIIIQGLNFIISAYQTWISPPSKGDRQVFVLKIVLNVSHFMVNSNQILHSDVSAHFYSAGAKKMYLMQL